VTKTATLVEKIIDCKKCEWIGMPPVGIRNGMRIDAKNVIKHKKPVSRETGFWYSAPGGRTF
jgi:hypothetical protein